MKNKKIALQILVFTLLVTSFIACDKDFTNLESDVINDDVATNFGIDKESFDLITYTEPIGPVQSNGLGLSTLGVYDDSYGRVTADFVVQPVLSSFEPDFGDDVVIDSVVLNIPYQFRVLEIDEDNNITYAVDSVIGRESLKFSLFESNYFIRDFDPDEEFGAIQPYYSNKSASETEFISQTLLEGEQLNFVPNPDEDKHISLDPQGDLLINEEGFILLGPEPEEENETQSIIRQPPGIRIKLEPTYWMDKIIAKEGDAVLSNANNFNEYFRGLYFKAEANDMDEGSYLFLSTNATSSNITIYYNRLTPSEDDDDERENAEFTLSLTGRSINFLEHNYTTPIIEGDEEIGDSRIYLKGGEGAIARIKLFNGDDINDGDDMTFDDFKNLFVETENGEFVRSKRLVNEANLIFYVDQDVVQGGEPDRIYLYDIENKRPLVDYFLDGINNSLPSFSVSNHLGPLERVNDEPDENGIRYKLRITEHINNLLVRDSTNIELGLAVSLNVNLEEAVTQRRVQFAEDSDFTVPISSVVSPRGTVLHGNATEDESKRVYLEIYYTEPND